MITAVDSSVLLAVLTNHPVLGPASGRALAAARNLGRVVICPIVWAEVGAHFPDVGDLRRALPGPGIRCEPLRVIEPEPAH